MIINKISYGYVVQAFDTDKKQFVSQKFYDAYQVEYETENGDPIDHDKLDETLPDSWPDLPFDMVQPK